MSEALRRILAALREHGHAPKRAGADWCCRCPAHEDRDPSLSISAGDDGRALLHCHAGCAPEAVLDAIGLRTCDLFAVPPTQRNGAAPRTRRSVSSDTVTTTPRIPERNRGMGDGDAKETFRTAPDALAELELRHGLRSGTWTYHDATGEAAGMILRWKTPEGKDIRPVSRRADGSGWVIGGMPTPRPLYRLPDLLAAPVGSRVWVCEGEQAADAARLLGLPATTSAHGSKSAKGTDWSPVAGREVVILPDHDEPGERYAEDVARLALAAGAKSVRVARLVDLWAGMPAGGDVVDLVKHHFGALPIHIRQRIEALAERAEPEAATPDAPAVASFQPFPINALPEPIRGFVTEAAKSIGCDSSYVALPLLAGLASAIGTRCVIELKRGWTEPAILWAAIVGESGTAKSPALELALRPIRKRQHEELKAHAEAMKAHADELAMHEREAARWKQGKADTTPPATPEAPVAVRCWTDDATTEALAVLLQQNPRGLLMARDELSGWFNFDRYAGGKGGGDVAKWLEMFGARPMLVDRKGGGTTYVPRAAVSIAGGIQPDTLRRALGQEHRDNGLAARLLLTCPPRTPKAWTEADVDPAMEAAVVKVFDRLFEKAPETDDDGTERPSVLPLATCGKAAWVEFFNTHADEQADLSGDMAAAWSKLEGYAARLALVVHLTRWAADDATLQDPERVDEASVVAGVVLTRWFGHEARRVYGILSESDEARESRRLAEWIERKGGTVTPRDLTHGLREYRGKPEEAERGLMALVADGVGRWVHDAHGPKGGRPVRRFQLVSTRTISTTHANAGK